MLVNFGLIKIDLLLNNERAVPLNCCTFSLVVKAIIIEACLQRGHIYLLFQTSVHLNGQLDPLIHLDFLVHFLVKSGSCPNEIGAIQT